VYFSRAGILIKGPSLKLLDPDSDQVARDVVAFGETVECLARNEVQGNLSFELDAMDAVLGHGFHPLKARQRRSIPNLQTVHRHGRIPVEVETLSPMRRPSVNKPLSIAYGTGELPAMTATSRDYHAYRSESHLAGDLIPIAKANHFTILDELRLADSHLTRQVLQLATYKVT
jgi:hypothetical protein